MRVVATKCDREKRVHGVFLHTCHTWEARTVRKNPVWDSRLSVKEGDGAVRKGLLR